MKSKKKIAVFCLCAVCLFGLSAVGGFVGYRLAAAPQGEEALYEQTVKAIGYKEGVGAGVTELGELYEGEGLSASADGAALSIVGVVQTAADAVVEIRTESVTTGRGMRQYIAEGAGSGVILTSDGYIATNHHVIDGAAKITVTTRAGQQYPAKLVGKDEKSDLAVIKIDASGLVAAQLGKSATLQVGERAVAIGNPLGELGGTVTEGIISALSRQIEMEGKTFTLLQTSAAVNPGNSGGGLFNAAGQLVGIVNGGASGDVDGIGFAIPIDTAAPILEQLMKNGYVAGRVTHNLSLIEITDWMTAMRYGVSYSGVYVSENVGGFQAGDRIVSVEGTAVGSIADFESVLENYAVGNTVSVLVDRNGRATAVGLTLIQKK